MKDTISLVPQVFYDLIGRVVPGAATLIVGALLLRNGDYAVAAASFVAWQSGGVLSVLVAGALLASYLLGTLLGAFGFAVCGNRPVTEGPLANLKLSPKDVDPDSLASYIYDFIHLRNPAAGGRLAKLRAEIHLCRVLIAGCIGLGALYGLERAAGAGRPAFWIVLIVLFATAASARFLSTHLAEGAGKLLKKLAPETGPRRVLMAVCLGLGAGFAIANTSPPGIGNLWVVMISLAATTWSSYLFHHHLTSRTQLLMANCWQILQQDESARLARDSGQSGHAPETRLTAVGER